MNQIDSFVSICLSNNIWVLKWNITESCWAERGSWKQHTSCGSICSCTQYNLINDFNVSRCSSVLLTSILLSYYFFSLSSIFFIHLILLSLQLIIISSSFSRSSQSLPCIITVFYSLFIHSDSICIPVYFHFSLSLHLLSISSSLMQFLKVKSLRSTQNTIATTQ